MSIYSIPNSNSIAASTTSASTGTKSTGDTSGNSSDDFMALLLAQLRNQNPFESMDNQSMMNQLTQLNSLQELKNIDTGLANLSKSNQLTEAASLIGKTVEVGVGNNKTISGVVTGVSLVKGQVMIWLDKQTVPLENLITISADGSLSGNNADG
jgi:flagellar basal-body rod modification protein FlgD